MAATNDTDIVRRTLCSVVLLTETFYQLKHCNSRVTCTQNAENFYCLLIASYFVKQSQNYVHNCYNSSKITHSRSAWPSRVSHFVTMEWFFQLKRTVYLRWFIAHRLNPSNALRATTRLRICNQMWLYQTTPRHLRCLVTTLSYSVMLIITTVPIGYGYAILRITNVHLQWDWVKLTNFDIRDLYRWNVANFPPTQTPHDMTYLTYRVKTSSWVK